MAKLIEEPAIVQAAGTPPKQIEEFVGRARTGFEAASAARMISPSGWTEPGQTPELDEITVVLAGELTAEFKDGEIRVGAGQALHVRAGEWVKYSTPGSIGAEYVAVCLPAFSQDLVCRDEMAETAVRPIKRI
ncbi:MAG: cupin domain-containing protein [Roseovarius sp.]|uniref:cupin domain-containing protein n=1 Tax=Roseobacteraceae TaxID=2854170 RepID=UPI0032EB12DD